MHFVSLGKCLGRQLHEQSLLIKPILGIFDARVSKYSQIRTKEHAEQVKKNKFLNNTDDTDFADIRISYYITFLPNLFFDVILIILVKEVVYYNRLYKMKQRLCVKESDNLFRRLKYFKNISLVPNARVHIPRWLKI